MTNEVKKKKDGEFSAILLACGIFTIALLVVDFTYSNFAAMRGWWLLGAAVSHIAVVALWVLVFITRNDPNKDFFRWLLIFAAIAALIIVMAHRASWVDDKMFDEDVNKAKQEQHDN